jgi:glycosyltransferase involved in cell wall biosynthesis
MKRNPSVIPDFRAFIRLYRFLSHHRYDVVHTHSSKAGIVGRLAAFLARAPHIVHTPHVFPFTQPAPQYRQAVYRLGETLLGSLTDRIIAVSAWQRSLAVEHGIGTKDSVALIHNGVTVETLRRGSSSREEGRARVREELDAKPSDLLVGTAGRLTLQKGQKYLLEAVAILLDRHPHLRFYIVGSGELEQELRRIIEQLSWCRQRISFLPERADFSDLLAATDIFVMPSLWEGMPYALLEAMAAERPVICTNVCGLDEVVKDGENGLLIPPADSRALAAAISRLVTDRALRKRLGAAARKTVQERFRLEEKLEMLAQLYRDLAAAGK